MAKTITDELREIWSRGGCTARDNVLGMFALSDEARTAANSKGGKTAHEKGVGIYGMGQEGLAQAGLVGGRVATLRRGQVPWIKRTGAIHDNTDEQLQS